MTAILATRLEVDYKRSPKFRAKLNINLKAKENHLKRFLEITEFDKLRRERWERPGFYFTINDAIIPTFSVNLGDHSQCNECKQSLGKEAAQFHQVEISE